MSVTIEEAAELIGVTKGAIFNSAKYQPFRRSANGVRGAASFDIVGYRGMEQKKDAMAKRTMLLVEYLRHIESMSYAEISAMSSVSESPLREHRVGYGSAIKICDGIKTNNPDAWCRFHDYYGFTDISKV